MSQSDSQPRVETVISLPFEQNCHILFWEGRSECVVFDPGLDPGQILTLLERENLSPAAMLITHGHADHIAGIGPLKKRWPACPVVIGRHDAPKLVDPHLNLSAVFGMPLVSPPADVLLSDADRYAAAGFEFEVHEIPGHSLGHVVYLWKGNAPYHAFVGDVLMRGSVGRTDLPNGSFQQLRSGILEKLFTLPDDTLVFSGHGPVTTIGREKRLNPFVGSSSKKHGL